MSNSSAYIIFEADQVLTNDHLNELFNYLDVEERLTRNKLIGIGIVCGLEVDVQPSAIAVSKGCGVTSKGYLIVHDDAFYEHYVSYTLPADPLYQPFVNEGTGKQYNLWRLLTDEDAKAVEGTKQQVNATFLRDKIVVLFLQASELDLKNCDTQDCNNEGRRMQFDLRALLVSRADMEAIILKQKKLSGQEGLSDSYIERLGLKDVMLRRVDVRATPMATAFDIFNAYLKCMDDASLDGIAEAYSQSYSIFKPILPGHTATNPFKNLGKELKTKLDYYRKSMPIFIQYYYDFLDDLIKAYNEFKDRSSEVITDCCPDEDLFPMHLMLGEASTDTRDYIRSPFRQYFISSPLFNQQRELLNEVQVLFDRMVKLVSNLFIPQFNQRQGVPIRITPSRYGNAPLSARAIPYYYNLQNIARSWSPLKSAKGKHNTNLSYNATSHSPAAPDTVVNPLQYRLEAYNFFRIEGHIGHDYQSALSTIVSNRNSFRLPFDVIAVKASSDGANTAIKYTCHFEDLEALFGVLKTELACKMHAPICLAGKMPTTMQLNLTGANLNFNFIELIGNFHQITLQDNIAAKNKLLVNFVQQFRFTRKGDFIKTYCAPKQGTLGFEYLNATNKFFSRPSRIDLTTTNGSRAALLHMIDIVEALMQTISGSVTIHSLSYDNFNRLYDQVNSYFTDFMQALLAAEGKERNLSPFLYGMLEEVVNSCMDEKIRALREEYNRRVQQLQKRNLFSEYIKANPGIDHLAGVPRGGTFILVYHETPPEQVPANASAANNALLRIDLIDNDVASRTSKDTQTTTSASNTKKKLAENSAISKDNLNQILDLVNTKELQLSKEQATLLSQLVKQRFSSAVARVPFSIPEFAVVADFYLPYQCCSDCPPVAYIIEEKPEVIVLAIDKTDFCNNDEKAYPIIATPAGGELTASAGGLDATKKEFRPGGLAAGVNKITYKLEDGRSKSIDVKITAAFQVDFRSAPTAASPLSIQFTATNNDLKKLKWDFGDGNTSDEISPVHQYSFEGEEKSFEVTLTAEDGPCVATVKHTIMVRRPGQQTFAIEPGIYCSNDRRPAVIEANPAIQNIQEIQNPNGLKLQQDATGRIGFLPSNHPVQQTTTFELTYKGIKATVQVIPAFEIDFNTEQVGNDPLSIRFIPVNTANKDVKWDFGDGQTSNEQSPVHKYQVNGEQKTFPVRLVAEQSPCLSEKKKEITIKNVVAQFGLERGVYCAHDKTDYTFNTSPAIKDVKEVKNPDNLDIRLNANGLFFSPSHQAIQQTKSYKLTYQGIVLNITIVVPDASFTMDVQSNATANVPVITLNAKQDGADEYKWQITAPQGLVTEFTGKQVNFGYGAVKAGAFAELKIVLVVSFAKQTGVNCSSTRDYVLTPVIARNHLNKGPFDNQTSS